MKDQSALVSIGIPTYNRPQGLRRTLSCLVNQTHLNLEIIVSDNCSPTNETAQVVAEFISKDNRISYFRQNEPLGIAGNFQFVLKKATGQFFMWAADDDEWDPRFVASCLAAMDQRSVSAMSAFETCYRLSGKRIRNFMPKLSKGTDIYENLIAFMNCMTPSLFYGLHKKEKIDFFLRDELFDYYDCYFVMRLITLGGIALVSESLYVAGVDAKVYEPKPFSGSWGSGLQVLPFYRATSAMLAEVSLPPIDRFILQAKLLLLVLRLLIANEGKSFFNKTVEAIFLMLGQTIRLLGLSSLLEFNTTFRDRWVKEQALQLPKGTVILDVGAGSCPYRHLFTHCDYRTQDFTGLQGDQLRFGQYGKIDYVCDATSIPVADSSFDALLCTEMLEHVPDPVKVVEEFGRMLRTNGKLMLTAPLGSGIHQEPYHFYGGFTPYWYERFLKQAGFRDIKVEPNGGFYRHYSQESLRFLQMTRPLSRQLPIWLSLLGTPFWLAMLPILGVMFPLLCAFLDRFDRSCHFTVGYHVTAIRAAKSTEE